MSINQVRDSITYSSSILRSNLESRRIKPNYLLLEIIGSIERIISDIDISSKSECEFSMRE
jgi:hypothetical protein